MRCSKDGRAFKMTRFKGIIILSAFAFISSFAWAEDDGSRMTGMRQPGQTGNMPSGNMPLPGNMPSGNMPGQMGQQPLEVPENIQLDRDMVFATIDGQELKLDIAYPKDNKGKLPAIVYIHGGGWEGGGKPTDQTVLFAGYGFVGIAIEYRVSSTAKFPAAVHDCKTAIRWIRANAKKYGIDPDRIGVIGESAGGHLSALMGASGGDAYLEGDGPYREYKSSVQAVVDLFGPTDLTAAEDAITPTMDYNSESSPVTKFLGKPPKDALDLAKKASPVAYVDAKTPPTLIIHGEMDNIVNMHQAELLYNALIKAGVKTNLIRVKNAGHGLGPASQGAEVRPSAKEIEAMEVQWFKDAFGMK